jgi:hypothetical protein
MQTYSFILPANLADPDADFHGVHSSGAVMCALHNNPVNKNAKKFKGILLSL